MTNKKTINMLSMIKVDKTGEFEPLHTWYGGIDKDMQEAVELAKKALSQPDIETIRQDIKNKLYRDSEWNEWVIREKDVMDIVDKYIHKTESEEV